MAAAAPIGEVRTKYRTVKKASTGSVQHRQHFVKVSHHGARRKRWRPQSRVIWERKVGPIPAGWQVYHKDGDSLNDDIGNLVLLREGRFRHILATNPKARELQRKRQLLAVIKSNQLRARVRQSQMSGDKWYLVLHDHRRVVVVPCDNPEQCRNLYHSRLSGWLARECLAMSTRCDAVLGKEIFRQMRPDGLFEAYQRFVPDERREPRPRQPKPIVSEMVSLGNLRSVPHQRSEHMTRLLALLIPLSICCTPSYAVDPVTKPATLTFPACQLYRLDAPLSKGDTAEWEFTDDDADVDVYYQRGGQSIVVFVPSPRRLPIIRRITAKDGKQTAEFIVAKVTGNSPDSEKPVLPINPKPDSKVSEFGQKLIEEAKKITHKDRVKQAAEIADAFKSVKAKVAATPEMAANKAAVIKAIIDQLRSLPAETYNTWQPWRALWADIGRQFWERSQKMTPENWYELFDETVAALGQVK